MDKQYVYRDEHGVYRPVGHPRMLLDLIVTSFNRSESPESIRDSWPFLSLEEINGCIRYYLANKQEVDEYMRCQELLWEKLKAEADANPPPVVQRLREIKKMSSHIVTLDEHGVYRVAGTRMVLDGIVFSFRDGMSAREIQNEYPDLTLEQVQGAIVFYLHHKDEIEKYMEERERKYEKLRAESEARPHPAREKVRAFKKARAEESA